MKTLAAGKFKAQCLALIDKIAQTHEELVVTKYGKPLVKVVPYNDKKDNSNKPLAGMATYIGDVFSPIDEEWEVDV
jgi:prevent-host-death family protein